MTTLIDQVRAHARDHYDRNGWDILVECWSDEEIGEAIGNTRTLRGCIAKIGPTLRAQADHRTEVQATAW